MITYPSSQVSKPKTIAKYQFVRLICITRSRMDSSIPVILGQAPAPYGQSLLGVLILVTSDHRSGLRLGHLPAFVYYFSTQFVVDPLSPLVT